MEMADKYKPDSDLKAGAWCLDSSLSALLHKLQFTPLDIDEIKNDCNSLKNYISSSVSYPDMKKIRDLIRYWENSPVTLREYLFSLIEALTFKLDDPSLFISELLFSDSKETCWLAAKLYDLNGNPAANKTINKILGADAARTLSNYLAYTRASHEDLLYLITESGGTTPILESIHQCQEICGENILSAVIAKLGWRAVNYGLTVKHYIGISINGSLPFYLYESEAVLFESSLKAERVDDILIFTARGGPPSGKIIQGDNNKQVLKFREYNLAHAMLLEEILSMVPLSPGRIKKIILQMDKIVDDFITLFDLYTEECKALPDVYGTIKEKIKRELDEDSAVYQLSAEVVRLVQMFEDPKSIGEVHTLHGLKRYLHQRGLQLGFKLVNQSRSPNQSINLVLTSGNKILTVVKDINYAEFESRPEPELSVTRLPYPVKVVADSFTRQMLYGHENFPQVNIFCYGNEVHYFVWFRNHPVFIRIDYSPPLQGGMIDLQYFGVSNYETADHPNIYLDAIRHFFMQLEYDIQMEGTHLHARYDKERALDLSQLCEKVEYLFCLVPYLMDLDWVIGSLNLDSEAKKKVTKTWAELFTRWGVLPISKLLTQDKLNILQDFQSNVEGVQEVKWQGGGDYRDRYMGRITQDFGDSILESVKKLGLKTPGFYANEAIPPGQFTLEKKFLNYIREAVSAGEIIETDSGFEKVSETLFHRVHESRIFAEIISEDSDEFNFSVALAKWLTALKQILQFQDTGTLESFTVQAAVLPLTGSIAKIFVLRDSAGIICMAFYVYGNLLYEKRNNPEGSWKTNLRLSPVEFMTLLRLNNYTVMWTEPSNDLIKEETLRIRDELHSQGRRVHPPHIQGEKIVNGLSASPGRAAGRVLLGEEGREPEEFDGHIFVSSSISPDENTIIYHSSGIIATGGGILSHAGLIATQFNKPAIIISGKWRRNQDSSLTLSYKTSEYRTVYRTVNNFMITENHDIYEKVHQMNDGDLVVLDADEGKLEILGQEKNTIALFEELIALGKTNDQISQVSDVKELLVLRGKKLHIRHQIEKIIQRISNPLLAKYAIQEILIGKFLEGSKSTPDERAYLIKLILKNDFIGINSKDYLLQTAENIEDKFTTIYNAAEKNIPLAKYPFEVIMPRLEVIRIYETIKNVISSVRTSLSSKRFIETRDLNEINTLCITHLQKLQRTLWEKIRYHADSGGAKEILRHLFRQLSRVNLLLNTPETEQPEINELRSRFENNDRKICDKMTEYYILKPQVGALELVPLIGWKAANLAEFEELGGRGLVPSWFAISDKAFQAVLDTPLKQNILFQGENISEGIIMREAIDKILRRDDICNRDKSFQIRNLWDRITVPEDVESKILKAYQEIEKEFISLAATQQKEREFYVAIRSSSSEEDAEIAARAGEFETYLFISGEVSVIEYLKKTWAGLWTERAIHNRKALGYEKIKTNGGVIVQRIVWSRVSGVLQTVNVAKGDLQEMVINAGLGLGEGIVSGTVAADQIIVSKAGNLEKGSFQFNYITADKTEQVVFNKKAGFGTVLSPTLYHQRFRPSLEYVELCELVAVAARLEAAYGYPLDIEFGIEGTKLWILQVRPVATFLPAFTETLTRYPLIKKENEFQEILK